MGILLGVYHLFLEREKIHHFNRYYLLVSIIFSLILPVISIPIYVGAKGTPDTMYNTLPVANTIITTITPVAEPVNYLPIVLWSVYGIVAIALSLNFIWNIASFRRKISSSKIIRYNKAKLVLIEKKILPHTFYNCIFINKQDYESGNIEDELFTHELTHVKQKHTLDILFIEILKVMFWFNPLLYLYGRSIRLNHEFLADEKVVSKTQNVTYYQTILLEKISEKTFAFASNLNFSLTKKRLIMMTKKTNRTKALLLQTAIAPIVAILLMLLCTEEVIAQEKDNSKGYSVHMESITASQIDSLKKADPVTYRNVNKEYFSVRKRYVDEVGNEVVEKSFETISDLYNSKGTTKTHKTIPLNLIHSSHNLTKQPEYIDGGLKGFYDDIYKNFKIPEINEDLNAQIYIAFVIEKDGSMSNKKVIMDPGHGLGIEAMRVLNEMDKKWIPGQMEEKIVRCMYTIPISIAFRS